MARLKSIIKDYKKRLRVTHRDSCLELAGRISQGTPIDTGHARLGWQNNGYPELGKDFTFTNNVVYIRKLEYDGHSPQARNGFVRVNVRNWVAIVRQIANRS